MTVDFTNQIPIKDALVEAKALVLKARMDGRLRKFQKPTRDARIDDERSPAL